MALLLIVALSAGFFSGLKITKDAMANTCEEFLNRQEFYDFRLFSSLGFTKEDMEEFSKLSGVKMAEGMKTVDALMEYNGNVKPYKLLSMPGSINLPSLSAGRMPKEEGECLADDKIFKEEDIGTVIRVAKENKEGNSQLKNKEYTIVGLADSPLYIGIDRGSTSIGSGAISAFLYLPKENFTGEYFTELNLRLGENAKIYSEEYDELIDGKKEKVTKFLKKQAKARQDELLLAQGITQDMTEQMGITAPETYVLTRKENVGYCNFENDTSIVSGIANIFPVFFILIAMLVCMTTMTRMVDEERTQIGVLKALGFSNGKIMQKYLLYAGSATLLGWIIGFFLCTWGIPKIFWFAYNALYDFAPLSYLFSGKLAWITLGVSLLGILGSTYFSCRKEFISVPAKLIRPRAAKNGKRILLERLTFLWKRLTFLQKITTRNMFRYKKRLIMMLVGISCCAGLVVTGFGVRDSMIHVADTQFEAIQKYDMEVTFTPGTQEEVRKKLKEIEGVTDVLMAYTTKVDVSKKKTMNSVNLLCFSEIDKVPSFWGFYKDGQEVTMPGQGEVIINKKIAEKLSLAVGDQMEIKNGDMESATFTVSGIFDNYIYNYLVLSKDTYEQNFGKWKQNLAQLKVQEESEQIAEKLTKIDAIKGVSQLSILKANVNNALSCLNYIITMVVLFAGALAFIVIFNLTNINLAERSREIATVQVLGFYPKETESYVLRENLILSFLASLIGLPLGTLFHRVVMSKIVIDIFSFQLRIEGRSYVMAFFITLFFALVVNLFMRRQIGKIHMTESLKAVE